MKLSKSKLALAKVINENGGWHGSDVWLFSTQSGDGVLKFWASKPKALKGCVCTEWSGGCRLNFALSRVIKNWHQTILSREEYYQAYPKADADGWIEWNGGECPVEKGLMVDIRVRDGREERNLAANTLTKGRTPDASCAFWKNDGMAGDIIAYRPHKPEVKPEFCESVMRSIPEPESIDGLCAKVTEENKHQHVDAKPTIEQLAQDYRNAKDYADRLQKEAGEAAVKAEEFAVEIRKKILELQELIG